MTSLGLFQHNDVSIGNKMAAVNYKGDAVLTFSDINCCLLIIISRNELFALC